MERVQVRSALRKRLMLGCVGTNHNLFLEEVGIRHGLARIDFLFVNGHCHGYEIKYRLEMVRALIQKAQVYNSALDRFTLVIADRHVAEAVDAIPVWWGIEVFEVGSSGVSFRTARDAAENVEVEKASMAKFLWRAEALDALNRLGAATGYRSKPRRAVYARLAECATLPFIREQVRLHLQRRKVEQAAKQ